MKRITSLTTACLVLLIVSACNDSGSGAGTIPEPTKISSEELPRAYTENFYILIGWDEQDGPGIFLNTLLDNSIPIDKAWTLDPESPSPCMVAIPTYLIVRLHRPDSRMQDLGYTQNISIIQGCAPGWLEYNF